MASDSLPILPRIKPMSENEQIIDLISRQTKALLENHWLDISDFRNDEESIKIGFSHNIGYEGQARVVETTISFAKRIKDKAVDSIDTDQMHLDFPGAPATAAAAIVASKKRRGRPPGSGKKNVLQLNPDPEDAA